MRIVRIPNGEYYLEKGTNLGLGALIFRANATNSKETGTIHLGNASIPKELMGKRFHLKVEVIK